MLKKLLCCLLSAAMLFSLCACSNGSDTRAATVNGSDIMRSEVESLVESTARMYIAFGVDEDTFYGDEESRQALYDGCLQALIERRLIIDIAYEQGLSALTKAQRAEYEEAGQAELQSLIDAAENNGADLSSMLAMLGSTEENYAENYADIAEYNRAISYLTALAKPTEEEYQAYYEKMVQSQKDNCDITPGYLGNYLYNGTLLYAPEGSAYMEYMVLGEDYDVSLGFVALLTEHQEDVEYGNAVVFPGSSEFSEDVTELLLTLEPGEETGSVTVDGKEYMFRRMGDYTLPDSWETMPDSMKKNVQESAGEAYLAELLAKANTDEHVTVYE